MFCKFNPEYVVQICPESNSNRMNKLETTIDINASVKKIWAVLMDFEVYSEWNSFLVSIKGTGDIGSQLENTILTVEKRRQKFNSIVLVNKKEKEFRCLGHLFAKGLFDGEHYFLLKPTKSGSTTLIYGEIFSGLLVKPILDLVKEDTHKGFVKMNETLKQRVEQINVVDSIK